MKPEYIILHHSLTKDGTEVNFNAIRHYHTAVLGWRNIGYHLILENQHGQTNVLMGRMFNETGAHCKQDGMNRKSIGICMIGNFDQEPPERLIWYQVKRVCRALMEMYDIPRENVKGHREYATYKSCPGRAINLDVFRNQL